MYVKIANNEVVEYPYSIDKFRADNPTISFPVEISNEKLASYGVYPVGYMPAPEFDPATQKMVVSSTPSLVDGSWNLTKTIVDLTSNEVASYNSVKAREVRNTRTSLLQETDWCALNDVTMSAEMSTYRQALRDVPSQEGFPHNITWPTKPTAALEG